MNGDESSCLFRIAIDVGETVTRLVLDDGIRVRAVKSSTTASDPVQGVLSALMKAAFEMRLSLAELLQGTALLVQSTAPALGGVDDVRLDRLGERLAEAGFTGRLVRSDVGDASLDGWISAALGDDTPPAL